MGIVFVPQVQEPVALKCRSQREGLKKHIFTSPAVLDEIVNCKPGECHRKDSGEGRKRRSGLRWVVIRNGFNQLPLQISGAHRRKVFCERCNRAEASTSSLFKPSASASENERKRYATRGGASPQLGARTGQLGPSSSDPDVNGIVAGGVQKAQILASPRSARLNRGLQIPW